MGSNNVTSLKFGCRTYRFINPLVQTLRYFHCVSQCFLAPYPPFRHFFSPVTPEVFKVHQLQTNHPPFVVSHSLPSKILQQTEEKCINQLWVPSSRSKPHQNKTTPLPSPLGVTGVPLKKSRSASKVVPHHDINTVMKYKFHQLSIISTTFFSGFWIAKLLLEGHPSREASSHHPTNTDPFC